MSEAMTALGGTTFGGTSSVASEAPLQGMVSLRADLSSAEVADAIRDVTGCEMPARRQIVRAAETAVCWMSPDEVLFLVPYAESATIVAVLEQALAGQHHLAVDVSDARAVFSIEGANAREVLARLSPVDLSPQALPAGEVRRTRLAQIPAAFWIDDRGVITLVCFRSVARYAFDVLCGAADSPSVGFDPRP